MFSVQSLSKTIVLVFLSLGLVNVSTKRVKRTLIYPAPRSKIQMIFGVGLPVALEDISVTMGYVVKANYFLPTNVSDYTEPDIILQRKRRSNAARWNLYKILSQFLQRFGGKSCILRSICEFVHMPLDKNFSVIEEILHLIFRPSTTNDYFIDPMDKEYVAAENIGRIARNACRSIYRNCAFNMLDLFTKLM